MNLLSRPLNPSRRRADGSTAAPLTSGRCWFADLGLSLGAADCTVAVPRISAIRRPFARVAPASRSHRS